MKPASSRTFPVILATAIAAAGFTAAPLKISLFVPQAQAQDAGRDAYMEQAEGKFEEWGKKLDAFAAKASERGGEAKEATKRELDKAWTDAKAGWAKLKSAGKDGWDDAKSALETNWRKLERAWDDAQS